MRRHLGTSDRLKETFYQVPGAPRLALLADLHGRPYEKILRSLRERQPEIIAICGDVACGSHPEDGISPLVSQPYILPFLEACAGIAPSFLALGNHEQWLDGDDLQAVRKTGVTLLDNDYIRTAIHGKELVIGGLTSGYVMDIRRFRESTPNLQERYPEPFRHMEHQPDCAWLPAFAAAPGFHILLSHHPEYFPLIPETVELCLCGHAHGGQWRFFGRGVFAPGQGLWPKWTRGVYEGRLAVSAGLSNTAAPIPRLFNPPEIVYLSSDELSGN